DVAEERLLPCVPADEVCGPLADHGGEVLAVAPHLLLPVPEIVHGSVRAPVEDVRVVVDAPGPEPEHLLEAVAGGRELLGRPEVPFAEQARAIAALPQAGGEGGLRRQARSTAAAA